ncbi:MAG: hypothetical protein ACYDGR_12770 [Candidatus Dormibacteria bacterium]
MSAQRSEATFTPEELTAGLDQLEQRALARQRVPLVPLPLAKAMQEFAGLETRRLSREMGEATARRRAVLLAMGQPGFPAELYIAKIRAAHRYRNVARELERSKRRSGIAFRALERAVQSRSALDPARLQQIVAETRRSLEPAAVTRKGPRADASQMFLLDELLLQEEPDRQARAPETSEIQ